jgi:hypothetical protein
MTVMMTAAGPAFASHCPATVSLTAVLVAEGVATGLTTARDSIPEDAVTAAGFIAAAGLAAAAVVVAVPLRAVYETEENCRQDEHYGNVETLLEKADQDLILHIDKVLRDMAVPSSATLPESSLTLPANKGGYLDSSPIGVKSFVHDLYNKYLAAGIVVGALADDKLASADAFLAQKKWKLAYRDYRQAYLMTVGAL